MAKDGIRLMHGDADNGWPLVVPRVLFTVYQPIIGGMAALVWLNLYELAGRWSGSDVPMDDRPGQEFDDLINEVRRRLGVSASDVTDALITLERAGLLKRDEGGFVLHWPSHRPPGELGVVEAGANSGIAGAGGVAGTSAATGASVGTGTGVGTGTSPGTATGVDPQTAQGEVAAGAGVVDGRDADADALPAQNERDAAGGHGDQTRWDSDEAGLKAVVAFYHQRIGMLGPSQFEKLRFWVEEMGMSSDVVALAIEETVQNARTPRMNYLEAVLTNWYNDGIRTVTDVQGAKRSRSSALPQRSEGAPNAAAYETIDPDAVRRWKEMYADEYDG